VGVERHAEHDGRRALRIFDVLDRELAGVEPRLRVVEREVVRLRERTVEGVGRECLAREEEQQHQSIRVAVKSRSAYEPASSTVHRKRIVALPLASIAIDDHSPQAPSSPGFTISISKPFVPSIPKTTASSLMLQPLPLSVSSLQRR